MRGHSEKPKLIALEELFSIFFHHFPVVQASVRFGTTPLRSGRDYESRKSGHGFYKSGLVALSTSADFLLLFGSINRLLIPASSERFELLRHPTLSGSRQVWTWIQQVVHRFRPTRSADSLGNRGESAAESYLKGLGCRILERQMRGLFGEIDLVALDRDVIVFVEVKTRTSVAAGHPTEAVDLNKQKKITRASLAYLKQKGWLNRSVRFDVVSIQWESDHDNPTIQHYKNAFESTGFGQMYS